MELKDGQTWIRREPGKVRYTTVHDDGDGRYSFLLIEGGCGEIHEWMAAQECVDALRGLGFVPYSEAIEDGLIDRPVVFSDTEGVLDDD